MHTLQFWTFFSIQFYWELEQNWKSSWNSFSDDETSTVPCNPNNIWVIWQYRALFSDINQTVLHNHKVTKCSNILWHHVRRILSTFRSEGIDRLTNTRDLTERVPFLNEWNDSMLINSSKAVEGIQNGEKAGRPGTEQETARGLSPRKWENKATFTTICNSKSVRSGSCHWRGGASNVNQTFSSSWI